MNNTTKKASSLASTSGGTINYGTYNSYNASDWIIYTSPEYACSEKDEYILGTQYLYGNGVSATYRSGLYDITDGTFVWTSDTWLSNSDIKFRTILFKLEQNHKYRTVISIKGGASSITFTLDIKAIAF